MRTAWIVCAIAWAAAAPARADVLVAEKIVTAMGGQTVQSSRTTYIKGALMRIESSRPERQTTTLYDLPAGFSFALDPPKRRAERGDIAARYAQLEHDYPRDKTTVSVKPTGTTKEIGEITAAEQAFSIRVPMTKDNELAVTLTGSAWVAANAAGSGDYNALADRAVESQLVLGAASNNRILLAAARAQTELYRALASIKGIPYAIDMTYDVDGHGVLAGMVRKAIAGTQSVSVVRVTTEPLDPALFSVPADWKVEKK